MVTVMRPSWDGALVQHFINTLTNPFVLRRRGVFAPSRRIEGPVTSTGSVRSLSPVEAPR